MASGCAHAQALARAAPAMRFLVAMFLINDAMVR